MPLKIVSSVNVAIVGEGSCVHACCALQCEQKGHTSNLEGLAECDPMHVCYLSHHLGGQRERVWPLEGDRDGIQVRIQSLSLRPRRPRGKKWRGGRMALKSQLHVRGSVGLKFSLSALAFVLFPETQARRISINFLRGKIY